MDTRAQRVEAKRRRVWAALHHHEGDRVPVGEFFWSRFLERAADELGLERGFDPYAHFDLDMIVVTPNMDPRIRNFEILEDDGGNITLKTGFGATIQRVRDNPMPLFLDFEVKTVDDMRRFEFDPADDARRYLDSIDDQSNGVGDTIVRALPPWVERVEACAKDFAVFGSVNDVYESLWRILGPDNTLYKIAEAPVDLAAFVERLGDFLVVVARKQIEYAGGSLSGFYLWGDVAYRGGMLFSPAFWRAVFKPQTKRICDEIHKAGLKVVYHGCGNSSAIFDDLIEAGVDCYNPLEAKAGLDVLDLKRRYGSRLAFNGNIDVTVLATGDREAIRREVLRKLNAAKDGGFIFQSDHSIPYTVAPADYAYALQLAREYGKYPLHLGEFDEHV